MAVPLFADDKAIGGVCVYDEQAHQFSPEDESIMTALAGLTLVVGIAVRVRVSGLDNQQARDSVQCISSQLSCPSVVSL